MNTNHFANYLENGCYLFLSANFLWGLYCVVLLWRHVAQLRFRDAEQQIEFLDQLQSFLDAQDYDGAAQLCDGDRRALPQLASAVIAHRHMNVDQLRQLANELLQRDVMASLEYRLSWIATVIKSGPLWGLFGTVLGMMAAFSRIGSGEKVAPSQIAAEISVALVCTAMGLATAIPFSYFLASLSIRVRSLHESLNFGIARLLDSFQALQPKNGGRR